MIWKQAQSRVIDLCSEVSMEEVTTTVPATPDWTVHDLVAHMTGVDHDITDGSMPAAPTDDWTATHVSQRQNMSLTEIMDEWQQLEPAVMQTFASGDQDAIGNLIADISVHEQDLRGALQKPGVRDHEGMMLSLQAFFDMFDQRVRDAGLPAVRITATSNRGAKDMVAGEGDAQCSVSVDAFELHRALTGRRSPQQVAAWNWQGDCAPYTDVFSFSGALRDSDLHE